MAAQLFCSDCSGDLGEGEVTVPAVPGLAFLNAALPYRFPLDVLLGRAKFRGDFPLALALGDLLVFHLADALASLGAEKPLLVAVPLPWQRGIRRGYNVPSLLARAVAEQTGSPLSLSGGLTRRRNTKRQARLTGAARDANVCGAFRARDMHGRFVVVVDDVVTTGATLAACAAACRDGGARGVGAIVLASAQDRAPRR